MSNKNYDLMKQASEMRAQAYDLLAKADRMLVACGDCSNGIQVAGDPAAAAVVQPQAPAAVAPVVLKLAQKTEVLSILDHVASAVKNHPDPEVAKHASELLLIATEIDKSAKVIEDGFETAGATDKRYVNEMETSFHGGVHEKGTQGDQSSAATDSFNTDKSNVMQDAVRNVLPYQKITL